MKAGDGIRKKGGKWTARYTDAHGRRREVVLEAKTRIEAREKRARLVAQVADARNGIPQDMTEATVAEVWKLYEPVAKKKANWRTIEGHWRNHLLPTFGAKKVRHLVRRDVRDFLDALEAKGLEPRTRDHIRIRLGAILTFASEEGIYRGENVAHAVGAVEVPETDPRVLPFEIVGDVIDAVPDFWRPFFALAVYLGLRSGELRALRPESVSSDWREVRVSRSGTRKTTKTKRSRGVPIPRACQPYLKVALDRAKGREWLFTTPEGQQLPRTIEPARMLRQALEKAGHISAWTASCYFRCRWSTTLTAREPTRCAKCGRAAKIRPASPFTFHDLRKTWETYMHDVANDPMAVFAMAGHSPEVAMRRYVAQNARRMGDRADLLDFKRLSPSIPRAGTDVVENDRGPADVDVLPTGADGGERS